MKLLYTFALLAVVVLTSCAKADYMEDMKAIIKTCQKEVQTTDEELTNFVKNGMNPADATEPIKCHIKCVMEKQGYFKNGEFDDKTFVENIPKIPTMKDHQAEITEVAAKCKGEKGTNDCDTGYKIAKCFKEHKAVFGIEGE